MIMNRIIFCILIGIYGCNIYGQGIGDVASNIYQPVTIMIQLVRAVSVLCGAGLILGSLLKYLEYRRNPVAVRLSMVIFMLLFGISLLLVSIIPMKGLSG